MDCTDLVEEEHDELQEDDLMPNSVSLMQTSGMRSTSGDLGIHSLATLSGPRSLFDGSERRNL